MLAEWLIIDGNNLVHQMPVVAGREFAATRMELARQIDEVGGLLARRVTLVFDGSHGGADDVFESSSIEVLYSPGNRTADDVIERMVSKAASAKREIVVVTSDRAEEDTVAAAGGEVMSCRRFLEELGLTGARMRQTMHSNAMRGGGAPSLGDLFPDTLSRRA